MKRKGYGIVILMAAVFVLLMYRWWQGEQKSIYDKHENRDNSVQEILYENAWIVEMKNGEVLLYENGRLHNFAVKSEETLNEVLADVTVAGNEVRRIGMKTDVISGKVLSVGDNTVEIEGYGRLELAENAAIIKNYGELENIELKEVVIGYAMQKFIVGEGKICGIVVDSRPEAENIRVLLMTDNYGTIYHDRIVISADGAFRIRYNDTVKEYAAGSELEIESETFSGDVRIYAETVDESARLKLCSVKRSCGIPYYHGTFEITKDDKGILVINEVSLEKYLYSVLPSEMPSSYGLEALKAQAVCARSYAYRQILKNGMGEYGAHVNDSSQYQVYNNVAENELTVRAVDETFGQILTCGDEVVEAYYFSTSCGHTTDADIWGENKLTYVKGKLLDGSSAELVLDTEEKFAAFIKNKSFESYDMNFAWYRWETELSLDEITKLAAKAGLGNNVGTVNGIKVLERGTGGIVKKLQLDGSAGSVIVEKEYTIRKLLNPKGKKIIRADGTAVTDFPLLPSAYFSAEPVYTDEKLTGYRFFGGGFGHGAGMSQNGAKAMTDRGFSYSEVLSYFYDGVSISNCYLH